MTPTYVGSLLLLTADEVLAKKILSSYTSTPHLKLPTSAAVLQYLNRHSDANTVFVDIRQLDDGVPLSKFETQVHDILPQTNVVFILTDVAQEKRLHLNACYNIL
jgi:hypothetical protein